MGKEIIVNANMAEEIRIAIRENKKLLDLDFENQSRTKHKGNVYKGIVSNIEDSLEAAFIEFGEDRQAFLPRSEIRPSLYPDGLERPRHAKVSDILKRGQEIVVQVTKDEIGNKGAAVSTYLSLPGRYIVLMHSDDCGGGISRKINDEGSRQAARDMLARLDVPDGMAVIIRTAGMEASPEDLMRDFQALCTTWQQIDKGAQLGRAPTMLYREPDIVIRTIRDYFSTDVDKIVIDDEEEFNDALEYFKERMPDLSKILTHHKKKDPIFHFYNIEEEISNLFNPEVKLPSGGYIIIEQTEALVSVDVNSGSSTKEDDHEATVYKTNLEAAEAVAHQLRLRDLGGIIVIDFIDMVSHRHRREVERAMRDAMYSDKARTKIGRISENGTLEFTRQRIRQSHSLVSLAACPSCNGTGRIRDVEGLSIAALRRISGHLSKRRSNLSKLSIFLPVEVATALNNQKRKDLLQLSEAHHLDIDIVGDPMLSNTEIDIKEEKRGQAGLDAASRKNTSRQKGRKSKNHDKPAVATPPPSIGPIPSLISAEELVKGKAEDDQPEIVDPRLSTEDPIYNALFGDVEVENVIEMKKEVKEEEEEKKEREFPREEAMPTSDENSFSDEPSELIFDEQKFLPLENEFEEEHFFDEEQPSFISHENGIASETTSYRRRQNGGHARNRRSARPGQPRRKRRTNLGNVSTKQERL